MTRYFRTRGGEMVHREGCPSQPPFPTWWNWADGMTVTEIVQAAEEVRVGLTFCKRCIAADEFPSEPTAPDDDDYLARPALGRTHPYGTGSL